MASPLTSVSFFGRFMICFCRKRKQLLKCWSLFLFFKFFKIAVTIHEVCLPKMKTAAILLLVIPVLLFFFRIICDDSLSFTTFTNYNPLQSNPLHLAEHPHSSNAHWRGLAGVGRPKVAPLIDGDSHLHKMSKNGFETSGSLNLADLQNDLTPRMSILHRIKRYYRPY